MAKVIKASGCWGWAAYHFRNGYGGFRAEGRMELSHRISFMLHKQSPLPCGMCVLHKCDNPGCVNPRHLFLGTKKDNNDDKVKKNRHPTRELHGNAVLNSKSVAEMRALKKETGATNKNLAIRFGVSVAQARRIVIGESWR